VVEVITRDERRYFGYIRANPSKKLYSILESFEDFRNAIEREKQEKAWTRAKPVTLIESANPKRDDLARDWDQPQAFRFVTRTA
jgi:predicted GIY-YIG superfamily endonuclease